MIRVNFSLNSGLFAAGNFQNRVQEVQFLRFLSGRYFAG